MATQATYFDGITAKSQDVAAVSDGTNLRFSGPQTPTMVWSISGLHAIDPPTVGQPYRLTHADKPGARLIIRDEAFIRLLIAQSPHLKGGYSRRDVGQLLGWTFGSLAFFALLGWLAMSVLPEPIARMLPHSWRERTGAQMEMAMVGTYKRCSTPEAERAFGSMLSKFAEGEPDLPPVSIHVYDLPILNAFAVNGGRIIVTRKLIEKADSPEELAGVLAHEIGHVAHLDPEAQMVRLAGVEVLSSMFSGSNGGNMSSNALFIATVLRHSRTAESEADAYARNVLEKSRIDSMGLKTFFEKISKMEAESKSNIAALNELGNIFATHPGTAERIKEIKPLPEGVIPRPAVSLAEWQAIKNICG